MFAEQEPLLALTFGARARLHHPAELPCSRQARLDPLCAAVPRVLCMMIVSRDSIIALSLRCEPAACFVELGEGWYGSLVMARHGRKAAELARCASRITLPRSTHDLSTAFAGRCPSTAVMPAKSDKYVDKAVALVRCAPGI